MNYDEITLADVEYAIRRDTRVRIVLWWLDKLSWQNQPSDEQIQAADAVAERILGEV